MMRRQIHLRLEWELEQAYRIRGTASSKRRQARSAKKMEKTKTNLIPSAENINKNTYFEKYVSMNWEDGNSDDMLP